MEEVYDKFFMLILYKKFGLEIYLYGELIYWYWLNKFSKYNNN